MSSLIIDSSDKDQESEGENAREDVQSGITLALEHDDVNELLPGEEIDAFDSDRVSEVDGDDWLLGDALANEDDCDDNADDDNYERFTAAFLDALGEHFRVAGGIMNIDALRSMSWSDLVSTCDESSAEYPGLVREPARPKIEIRRAAESPSLALFPLHSESTLGRSVRGDQPLSPADAEQSRERAEGKAKAMSRHRQGNDGRASSRHPITTSTRAAI